MKCFILTFFATILVSTISIAQGFQHVDAKTFAEKIKSNEGIILDVRTPGEYSRGHIDGATLIDVYDAKFRNKVSMLQKNKTIYVYCLTGSRSRSVANYLSQNGFAKIYNLANGILEWQQLGYPIKQSEAPLTSANKAYSQADFNILLQSKDLILVDFHAPWCAPCKKLSPIVDDVQKKYQGKATIEKIDIEANAALKTNYNIQSIPGLVLFKKGKEVWRHTGLITHEELSAVLNQHL